MIDDGGFTWLLTGLFGGFGLKYSWRGATTDGKFAGVLTGLFDGCGGKLKICGGGGNDVAGVLLAKRIK